MTVSRYVHHGAEVSVIDEVKGKHRDHCLCFTCAKFVPGLPTNCAISQALYENCIKFNLVTPVYECPVYEAAQ
jgi:hypothetical protein